jgi:hypothetical protein
MRLRLGASGAERQCAPAPPFRRRRAGPQLPRQGAAVLSDNHSVHLRYVLLLNALAALVPALPVKGRANAPLLHTTWWNHEQHSAVLVVSAATIVGTVLKTLTRQRPRFSRGLA